MTSGVYKIVNPTNNRFYIGSSFDIYGRWQAHKHTLERGVHANIHLQRAFNKANCEFLYEIIEECPESSLIEREQYYLDLLIPRYNIARRAYSCSGIIRREETKQKIRETLKGYKQTDEHRSNIARSQIGKTKTLETKRKIASSKFGSNNPVFKTGWDKQIEAMKIVNTGKERTEDTRNTISEKLSVPIVQLDLQGNFIREWISAIEVERTLGFANGDINNVCNKVIKRGYPIRTAYKFKWMFKQEYYDNKENNS
jgi:group I intron endonuclease